MSMDTKITKFILMNYHEQPNWMLYVITQQNRIFINGYNMELTQPHETIPHMEMMGRKHARNGTGRKTHYKFRMTSIYESITPQ